MRKYGSKAIGAEERGVIKFELSKSQAQLVTERKQLNLVKNKLHSVAAVSVQSWGPVLHSPYLLRRVPAPQLPDPVALLSWLEIRVTAESCNQSSKDYPFYAENFANVHGREPPDPLTVIIRKAPNLGNNELSANVLPYILRQAVEHPSCKAPRALIFQIVGQGKTY
ncbi:hypothetical protein HWI79_2576 [Cryptosporidium felis]|nr:hypothetical protein HWI79_2576 [Cryptosporidium felis]